MEILRFTCFDIHKVYVNKDFLERSIVNFFIFVLHQWIKHERVGANFCSSRIRRCLDFSKSHGGGCSWSSDS